MTTPAATAPPPALLTFRGGLGGALLPFVVFLAGVGWLGLSGAPDERGFWPVLVAALTVGLLITHDRRRFIETMLAGMARPLVMLMVMAWSLAGILSALLGASGFIQALVWIARWAGLAGGGYVAGAFLVCAVVATSTGTSLGTILICGPLLYPAGAAVGAAPAMLIGAILAGATFGDSISPISDTTIASAGTQGADIGGVVRARAKYVLPAGLVMLVAAVVFGGSGQVPASVGASATPGDPRGLPMLAVPAVVVSLLLARRHLLEGLLAGSLVALAIGLPLGLIRRTNCSGSIPAALPPGASSSTASSAAWASSCSRCCSSASFRPSRRRAPWAGWSSSCGGAPRAAGRRRSGLSAR